MLRSEPRLEPAALDELERLEAALRGAPAESAEDVDLAELVADVRATRPTLDADARIRLDERAAEIQAADARRPGARAGRRTRPARAGSAASGAVGRPTAPPRSGGGLRRWRLGLAAVAAAAVVAVPVASTVLGPDDRDGVGSSDVLAVEQEASRPDGAAAGAPEASLGSQSGSAERAPGGAASGAPTPASPANGGAARSASGTGPAGPTGSPRRVIRDVTQTVRVGRDDVAAAAARVGRVVEDEGGYLASSTVRERGASAGGSFAVVVPTERLDATVSALSRIGRSVRLERSSSDVTDRAASLQDRLDDLRAERAAARLALARTVDPERRTARRRELAVLSSRVAGATADRDALRRRTSTATIALQLTTESEDEAVPALDDGTWGIGDAWQDARRILETTAGGALLVAVVLLPIALLLGLAVSLRRRRASAARNRLVDAA